MFVEKITKNEIVPSKGKEHISPYELECLTNFFSILIQIDRRKNKEKRYEKYTK